MADDITDLFKQFQENMARAGLVVPVAPSNPPPAPPQREEGGEPSILRVWWLMLRAWVRGLFHRPRQRQLASGGVYREPGAQPPALCPTCRERCGAVTSDSSASNEVKKEEAPRPKPTSIPSAGRKMLT